MASHRIEAVCWTFPYYGEPYSRSDQAGFGPLVHTGSY